MDSILRVICLLESSTMTFISASTAYRFNKVAHAFLDQLLLSLILCTSQIKASTSTPRAFDAFSWREFDHHSQGVGNLIASLDSR